ncbi:cytochrome P450 71A9-like [Papaver somniferum]|uniref:cytochrome P450 71A9-like n=1 Tax=Papaver somniferum TaxID=3469 RepID=UPI000E704E23|nr:cytochrome P450 71A9-like [Papaver somniferum]
MAVLELLSAKRVLSYRAVREKETSLVIDFLCTSTSSSVPINISEIFLCLINNVVCQVAFGMKYQAEKGYEAGHNHLYVMLLETQNLLAGFNTADLFPWMSWIHKFDGLDTRLDKNFAQADKFYEKVIHEHINNSNSSKTGVKDFVDVLLRTQKDPSYSITLTNDHIKAILMDTFVAGTDPTAATLVWSMTELIKNSTVMKRAQEEIRTKTGTKEMVEENDLHKLSYTKLVIKEALILHPPAPLLLRETNEACKINGYDIPLKTKVIINGNAISKDPKYWKNPEEFRPERFLDNSIDRKGQEFEMIPFGGGRRCCPGMNFSMVLVELVLENLLHCFDWKLPLGMKAEDTDMTEASGLTMHKKVPLFLVADNRK